MSRSELGTVTPGDKLLVLRPSPRNGKRLGDPIETVVTSAARVWIEMKETDPDKRHPATWRMSNKTQNDSTSKSVGYPTRFVTPEQWAWDQRVEAAVVYLADINLTIDFHSPWSREGDRTLLLANLIRKHYELEEL